MASNLSLEVLWCIASLCISGPLSPPIFTVTEFYISSGMHVCKSPQNHLVSTCAFGHVLLAIQTTDTYRQQHIFSRTLHYHIQDELLWKTPLYRSGCGYLKISVRESNCSSFECFVLYLIFLRTNPLALVRLMISSLASSCFIFLSPPCSSNRAI